MDGAKTWYASNIFSLAFVGFFPFLFFRIFFGSKDAHKLMGNTYSSKQHQHPPFNIAGTSNCCEIPYSRFIHGPDFVEKKKMKKKKMEKEEGKN